MSGSDYPEHRLTARRRVTKRKFAPGMAMFAVALVAAATSGDLISWLGVIFCGFVVAVLAFDRIRPETLVIRSDGVETVGPLGGRKSYQYTRCGPFDVFEQMAARGVRVDWLTFDHTGNGSLTWLQRLNSRMTGANSQIRADGFELDAHEIAALLNNYRDAALSRAKRD